MGIIDSKNLLTATENIKPKATKPYSKRRKNPFAKQFKLTDRNAPKDASASESLTGILNAKPANKTVLTDNRPQGKKPVLTDNRTQNKKPVLTDNKSSEKKSILADGRNDKKPVLTDNKPHYNKNKQEPRKQEYPSSFRPLQRKKGTPAYSVNACSFYNAACCL